MNACKRSFQVHHLTTSPPHHLTTSPPHHLTTSPPHHLRTGNPTMLAPRPNPAPDLADTPIVGM